MTTTCTTTTTATAEAHGLLFPPSGKFCNSGILFPGELRTFRGSESPPTPVKSSLRSILERAEKDATTRFVAQHAERVVTTCPMPYGSICSGVEAATVAWEPLGWQPQWFSEIGRFPSAVLQHRYPSVPNLGDMTTVYDKQAFVESDIDLLVGGTPCQPFSSNGKGAGLADPRGQLAIEFLRIAGVKKPRWLIWENVPRVLSCNGGRDFAAFLWKISELGYSFAYRVLDAQFFGVPQRRRRVFLVGYLGDWRPPALVFDPGCWMRLERVDRTKNPSLSDFMETCSESDLPIGIDNRNKKAMKSDTAVTVTANSFGITNDGPKVLGKDGIIRSHTPTECERLMGFNDGYTLVDYRCRHNEKLANRRIESLGNSMAVPVMRWLGERIAMFETGRLARTDLPEDWRQQAEVDAEPVEQKVVEP